jgi:hypothetical protein
MSVFTDDEIKVLAIKLASAEKEQEVDRILKEYDLLGDEYWEPFGNNENNFSVIGAQQSSPEAALVEKLINSVDAVLIRKALENGVALEGEKAPKSIPEALQFLFDIPDGKLSNLSTHNRANLANNIKLLATGRKTSPCYCIVDKGEGQTPNKLPQTILSLSKSNKLRIPFVQGKFNMGGTGVLQFCGNQNYQLVISKRCPSIPDSYNLYNGKIDSSKDSWGVTIVRRSQPRHGAKSSVYEYLAYNNTILNFKSDSLNIHGESLEWGTFIKLYDYKIGSLKTAATLNLYYALSILLPSVALPIRIMEKRDYRGNTLETTLTGLNVRLQEDRSKNLEEGFPYESELSVEGQKIKYSINVFKEGKDDNYRNKNEGVIFVINGQTHGYIPKSIFNRKSVGLGYLAGSILTILDCSNLSLRAREDLFMNSRDKLRNVELKKRIEDILEDLFSQDTHLKKLQKERRRKALQDQLNNSKPMTEVLENIIKSNPTLKELLLGGGTIQNPFDPSDGDNQSHPFIGIRYPTYFKLVDSFQHPKIVPINKKARIKFKTDAEDNYLGRIDDPGILDLTLNENSVLDYSLNQSNGTVTINIKLPPTCNVGDILHYKIEVTDSSQLKPFIQEVAIEVGIKIKNSPGGNTPPRNRTKTLSPPQVTEITKEKWEQYSMDGDGSLRVFDSGEGTYDFFINIDNHHLLTELSKHKDTEKIEIIKSQYKFGMALVGLATIQYYLNKDNKNEGNTDEDRDISEIVYEHTKILSPIFIPMIYSVGGIGVEDTVNS